MGVVLHEELFWQFLVVDVEVDELSDGFECFFAWLFVDVSAELAV